SYRERGEIGARAEVGENAIREREERVIARVGAPHRQRPGHGPVESTLPGDAFEDECRHGDATPALRRDHQERRGRSTDGRQGWCKLVEIDPTESGIARVDHNEAKAFASQGGRGRERDRMPMGANDEDAFEVDARVLRRTRIEGRGRIYPG